MMGKFEKDTGAGRFFKDFKKYHGLPVQDAIFFNQSDLICDMAKHEDFIVMGRCADVVLTNHHIPHISIFITASFRWNGLLTYKLQFHIFLSDHKFHFCAVYKRQIMSHVSYRKIKADRIIILFY